MTSRSRPPLPTAAGVAHQVSLSDALQDSEPLAGLLQRMRQSQERLACIAPLLPEALRARVRAGPVDERGWSLLVDNAAAAAKLRQLQPDLLAHLRQHGWNDPGLRLRVQAGPR